MLETSHLEVSDESAASNTIYTVNSMMGPLFYNFSFTPPFPSFKPVLSAGRDSSGHFESTAQETIIHIILIIHLAQELFPCFSLTEACAGGIPDLIWGSGLEEQASVYFTAPVLQSLRGVLAYF